MEIVVSQKAVPVIWNESLIAFLQNQTAEKTRSDYRRELGMFARWVGKNALAVVPSDIISYKSEMEEKGLKPSTVHKKVAVIKSFYKFVSMTLNVPNPSMCVKLPRVEDTSSKAVLSLQETARLFAAINTETTLGKRDKAVMALLCVNALRSIECSRADVGDIHIVDGFTVLRVKGKGMRIADAKIRPDVAKAINDYLMTRTATKPDEPLFLSTGNLGRGRISPRTIQARVRHYMKVAGVEKAGLSPHSLRATAAVLTLSLGGADLVKVQRMLRHSSPQTTMIYLKNLDWLRDAGVDHNPISLN